MRQSDGTFVYPKTADAFVRRTVRPQQPAKVPVAAKTCNRCFKLCLESEFRKLPKRLHPYCRPCEKAYNRERVVRKRIRK